MSPPVKLGAGSAILAYVALWVGMVMIGGPAQFRGLVSGLWITEALAIALPAAFTLGVAGVRFLPWLGLRRPSWKHALIAAGLAAISACFRSEEHTSELPSRLHLVFRLLLV